MRSIAVRFVLALLPVLVLGGVVWVVLVPWRAAVVEALVLLVGWLAVVAFVRVALLPHEPRESSFERAVRARTPRPKRIESLVSLERRVALATAAAVHVHFRLRPILREIASARLAARGIDLDRDSDGARAVLGERLSELVRADRERPADAFAPGIPLAELEEHVATLEAA